MRVSNKPQQTFEARETARCGEGENHSDKPGGLSQGLEVIKPGQREFRAELAPFVDFEGGVFRVLPPGFGEGWRRGRRGFFPERGVGLPGFGGGFHLYSSPISSI